MTFKLMVPTRFLKTREQVMEAAAQIGADNGRDEEDVPASLDAALLEILLFGQSAREAGVLFFPSNVPKRGYYRFHAPVDLLSTGAKIRHEGRIFLPDGWRGTVANTLVAVMNSGESPSEMCFEVDDSGYYGPETSAHEQIAEYDHVKGNPYTGPDTRGLDHTVLASRELLT
jgi:hypothetical protein